MTLNVVYFAKLRARFAVLTEVVARRFAALRIAVSKRLAIVRDTVTSVVARAVDIARGLMTRAGSALSSRDAIGFDQVRAALATPDALPVAVRAYVALWALGIVFSVVRAPVFLLVLLSLAQGAMKLALAAIVIASAFEYIRETAVVRPWLHALRVGAAVGLLWLAGVSFALGHSVYPRPVNEVAAHAPAGPINAPPDVVAGTTTSEPFPGQRASERSSRLHSRVATPTGLS